MTATMSTRDDIDRAHLRRVAEEARQYPRPAIRVGDDSPLTRFGQEWTPDICLALLDELSRKETALQAQLVELERLREALELSREASSCLGQAVLAVKAGRLRSAARHADRAAELDDRSRALTEKK